MSRIKTRPAGEAEARDKVSRGTEAEKAETPYTVTAAATAAAALRNFHFAGIVSARASPGGMEAAERR